MSTHDTIMALAIVDQIREILAAHRPLDEVKAFVRGGAPVGGMPLDRYPFCEIFLASEEDVEEYTGRLTRVLYRGAITVVARQNDQVQQERQGDRFYETTSYVLVSTFVHEIVRELRREENLDLQELSTTYDNLTETVVDFALDGPREYGIEPAERRNNFEQFAVIPFTAETHRQEALE
jgi:hypothetical protein